MKRGDKVGLGTIIVGSIVTIAVLIGIIYGIYRLKRWFNWSMAYQTQVEETVREMVKPECLKEAYRKKGE